MKDYGHNSDCATSTQLVDVAKNTCNVYAAEYCSSPLRLKIYFFFRFTR